MTESTLLAHLLKRGDRVSVSQGQLLIEPQSGSEVPDEWMQQNADRLAHDIGSALNISVFRYQSYSTGQYEFKRKNGGVIHIPGANIQMLDLIHITKAFCIFNVELTRDRNTKHGKEGAPLPEKQFRPRPGSDFVKFWQLCPFKPRKDNCSYHRRMGNLKPLILTGCYKEDEKVVTSSLRPLSITHDELFSSVMKGQTVRKACVTGVYDVRKACVSSVCNESAQTQTTQGLQPNLTTGAICYGNTVNRLKVNRDTSLQDIEDKGAEYKTVDQQSIQPPTVQQPTVKKRPEEQTTDEWLEPYYQEADS